MRAAVLGIDPGPLTVSRLRTILNGEESEGLLQQLKQSRKPEKLAAALPRLAALWEVLVPAPERSTIITGQAKRLIVIPDGLLARLPFETLVVESGDTPKYLLSEGPAVQYAPSATILLNLAEREGSPQVASPQPVLTIGNPRYGTPTGPSTDGALAKLTPRSRYHRAGGSLQPLPYSDWEASWVAEVFGEQKIRVASLKGELATEAAVRRNVPGRRILHFACHGLVDDAYGNYFGSLVLTPGPVADPATQTLAQLQQMRVQAVL